MTFARSVPATLAGTPETRYTLSPHSSLTLPAGARLVLPSPNGSTCTVIAAAMGARVIAGSLRNEKAVTRFITREFPGAVVSVIA